MNGPWKDLMFFKSDPVLSGGPRAYKWAYVRAHRAQFLPLANAYREAAIADGWHAEPLYPGHEAIEFAARLTKSGYTMHVMARHHTNVCPMPHVSIWGPDGAAIEPPLEYDWAAIVAGQMVCGQCGAEGVETKRIAFANRVCATCEPGFLKSLPSNWAN